tara:strand:- start:4152 stop:4568 length:417 start_codon:yes stop_codon:yes gene_type:complete
MSYQLLPAYYTTANTRKKKKPKINKDKMLIEMKKHNKDMRRIRAFSCQFDTVEEYITYRFGNKKIRKNNNEFKPHVPEKRVVKSDIKTSNTVPGACPVRPKREYTGDYIVGIATMHKSNSVPVGRKTDPKEFATMRRG